MQQQLPQACGVLDSEQRLNHRPRAHRAFSTRLTLLLALVAGGCADSVSPTILSLQASPQQGVPGDAVTFTWNIRDNRSGRLDCFLDIEGDGTADQQLENCVGEGTATAVYPTEGAYTALLTVEDRAGNMAQASLPITIAKAVDIGPGLKVLTEADLTGGATFLSFSNLKSSEQVAIIPVNADKSTALDGMPFQLTPSGFTDPKRVGTSAAPAAGPARALQPVRPSGKADAQASLSVVNAAAGPSLDAHLRLLERDRALGNDLSAKVRQRGAHRQGPDAGYDNCPQPYSVGKECGFYVFAVDESGSEVSTRIMTQLRYESASAYWFVDEQDLTDLKDSEIQAVSQVFEETIVPSDNRYFGEFSDVDENGKIFIVFSRLLWDTGVLGYVISIDLFPDEEIYPEYGTHSNEGDIFYATSPGPVVSSNYATREQYFDIVLPATLVHELKHLIAGGVRVLGGAEQEELWIEEGSAQAAQELVQMGDSQYYVEPMLQAPQNFNLVYDGRPSGVAGSGLYGYSFLLAWRIAETVGHDAFWRSWTAGPETGVTNLELRTERSWNDLMIDFSTTLLFDHTGIFEGYDYSSLNLRTGQNWPELGYSSLSNGTAIDHARSAAYFVGAGSGGTATVMLSSSAAHPRFVVARYEGDLGWGETEPSGGNLGGTLVSAELDLTDTWIMACPENEYCVYYQQITESDATQPWRIPSLPAQKYNLLVIKDNDGDGWYSNGDLAGFLTNEDGSELGTVVPPKTDIELQVFIYDY